MVELERDPPKRDVFAGFVKGGGSMTAVVLLSGDFKSTVALYWAVKAFRHGSVHGIFFNYGQRALTQEIETAYRVWNQCREENSNLNPTLKTILIPLESHILITGEDDTIPLRTTVFSSIAAHHLMMLNEQGGYVVLGTSPTLGNNSGITEYAEYMTVALSKDAGKPITVMCPLNTFAPTIEQSRLLAQGLPGCMDALRVVADSDAW